MANPLAEQSFRRLPKLSSYRYTCFAWRHVGCLDERTQHCRHGDSDNADMVMVIAHALGEHSGWHTDFADQLSTEGMASLMRGDFLPVSITKRIALVLNNACVLASPISQPSDYR
ncbi:hypothetical protein FHS27_002896 [Rhodopirellula rubra]|uniref:Uncharacterized protein n=1 Tax=Aporhodopirellula rubra TaxID=980271 RepID=A0A7W5E0M6_9BACT|nr:hypothetical protein [Aporhodopirellula rubra]